MTTRVEIQVNLAPEAMSFSYTCALYFGIHHPSYYPRYGLSETLDLPIDYQACVIEDETQGMLGPCIYTSELHLQLLIAF